MDNIKLDKSAEELYTMITEAAEEHGRESEPDHEVGDLQDALQLALDQMFPDQIERLQKAWEESKEN